MIDSEKPGFCQNCSIKLIKHFDLKGSQQTRVIVEESKKPDTLLSKRSTNGGIEVGGSTKITKKSAMLVGMFALVAVACFVGT